MKMPGYEETRLQPLTTDALVEQRVADLIGRAIQHQLWFLFLDDERVQLPLLIPVSELPARPDEFVEALASRLGEVAHEVGAASVVVVIERYADATLTVVDKQWALSVHDALERSRVAVRGILLSHRKGVRWVAQDDYRF